MESTQDFSKRIEVMEDLKWLKELRQIYSEMVTSFVLPHEARKKAVQFKMLINHRIFKILYSDKYLNTDEQKFLN